jgi:hypothetical protein
VVTLDPCPPFQNVNTEKAPEVDSVDGKLFHKRTVCLDDKQFTNCSFEECCSFDGSNRCEWENCIFQNCRVFLEDHASNTMQVVLGLGL